MPTGEAAKRPFDVKDIKTAEGEDVPSIYINNAAINYTSWDVRILLSEVMLEINGQVVSHPRANIVMSPGHAKVLASALAGVVERQEEELAKASAKPAASAQ